MDPKSICLRLMAAESEGDVQAIIDSVPEMREGKNWRPLDDRETNFNVTSNQASDGGKALTELMTNMVDAVLMKHALLKGIDPKGPTAPKSMHAAVDLLIKPLHGGRLTSLDPDDEWLRTFAQANLVIGVTGAKTKRTGLPCYTFADNGEGQRPESFRSTFLSLSSGNKKDIPFVQGKYNMGSSGVLSYCGMRWFKLIVSRRYDGDAPWGFTLVRKRPGNSDQMPVAEYFVLPSGAIPNFQEQVLFPFAKSNGKRYEGVHFKTGTVIKLYDYQIGSRFSSGFRGSREALNENLVDTILPFRILDFRQTPDPKRTGDRAEGIDPRGFCGMEFLLLRSHREPEVDDEEDVFGTGRIAIGSYTGKDLGTIQVYGIKLKRQLPAWLNSSNNRVFHAVNGQVQFKQTRGYVAQTCGFPALKDRAVIVVDASDLTFAAHNEIWKGDREHVRDTIVGERYKDVVTSVIKDSEVLREFQHQVAQEELSQSANTQKNELFQKLVDRDRNLASLLGHRDPVISIPFGAQRGKGTGTEREEFEGKFSPTFLRFEEKIREREVEIQISKTRPIAARTDAANDFFQRQEVKGRLVIAPDFYDKFEVREQLHNGRLTLYLAPLSDDLRLGESVILTVGLEDDAMASPVSDTVKLKIVPDLPPAPKPQPVPTPPAQNVKTNGNGSGHGAMRPAYGLPQFRLLTKDGRKIGDEQTEAWPSDFSEGDGGIIEDLGEDGMLYKINWDNAYHLKYRLSMRGDVARDVVTEKYILGMRILMLGYEHAWRIMQESLQNRVDGIAEFQDQFRRMAARGAAATVLALAENLPKIVDSSAVLNRDAE